MLLTICFLGLNTHTHTQHTEHFYFVQKYNTHTHTHTPVIHLLTEMLEKFNSYEYHLDETQIQLSMSVRSKILMYGKEASN
mmetsp:Transcript_9588/g.14235  ORF Transcript_9588/g.14235 Transcript_9588/m.14235 type:complete len:81 (-) Transcript_9588:376-618(-)